MSDDESFLTRWSRRKQAGAAEPEPLPGAAIDAEAAEVPPEPVEDLRSDDEILSELGLPHPDELKPGDDVHGFMRAAVPARLRRLALRQLWRGNPVLANLDGLVDYGEDFTDSATVIENMQSLYQVGKGIWHEVVAPDEAEETPEPGTTSPDDVPRPESGGTPAPADDPEDSPEETPAIAAAPTSPPDEPETAPTRRRMAFNFDS